MHLTLDDRITIENHLNNNISLKQIGRDLNKHSSSISREIKNHYITKNTGSVGRAFNNCLFRRVCPNRGKNCNIKNCTNFKEEICSSLNKTPYVCNGCKKKTQCTLSKRFYNATYAQDEYKDSLKEARSSVVIDQSEIQHLNNILVPLVKQQGQSIIMQLLIIKIKLCVQKVKYTN